ncbi:MAG: DUF1573 domain-containing protein [Prevotella sp.]|nr:DUF1573 domain-containing protein [Prevotella sp.]
MYRKIWMTALFLLSMTWTMAQGIDVKNAIVDVGQVKFCNPVTVEYELKNNTNRPLLITKVQPGCGCVVVDYPHNSVVRDGSFVIRAMYDAQQLGHFERHLEVFAYGMDDPLFLTMKGVVVEEVVDFTGDYPFKLGDLLADANTIEFDDVNRGDRPSAKIHINNPTSETVQPLLMHLPNYLSAEVSPSKISSGKGGELTFTLNTSLLPHDGLVQTSVFLGKTPGDKVAADKEIGISAVLMPGFADMTDYQRRNAPNMKLSTTSLDLGAFNGKKKLRGEIEITNTGKSRLDITAIQMYTVGIQVEMDKVKIMPGETVKMKISVVAKDLKTTKSKPRVLMITNDPNHAKVIIDILVK